MLQVKIVLGLKFPPLHFAMRLLTAITSAITYRYRWRVRIIFVKVNSEISQYANVDVDVTQLL